MESMKTVAVSQRKGSCCIHQTVITTLRPKYSTTDDQKFWGLIAEASREIDDGDYDWVAAQVVAIEAAVAQVKQVDEAMAFEKNWIEKLEMELAELKRELERYRQERRWTATPLIGMVARALLPDGITRKLRFVRDGLNLILGD